MDARTQTNLWDSRIVPAAALTVYFVVCSLLLRPYDNLPFVDDWTYAWSVEQLLKTGELHISNWSAHYPLAQILWGSLFSLPFGFSFTALRVSTVVLAWLGALAFYGTLRELGRPRPDCLIATLLLLANPVFFILTFSYMTDVPFVSLANIAFFFFILGIRRDRVKHLWLGSLFALIAFFMRQVALAIPISVLVYFFAFAYCRRWAYLLSPGLCSLFLLSTPLWINSLFGFTQVYAQKLHSLQYWFDVSALGYAHAMMSVLSHIALVLAPLTLPYFVRARKPLLWRLTLLVLLSEVVVSVLMGAASLPIAKAGTWTLEELGPLLPLLGGAKAVIAESPVRSFVPAWCNYLLALISSLSLAVIIARVFKVVRHRTDTTAFVFLSYTVCQTGLVFILWLFTDRYYLVLLPALIVVLASQGLASKRWTTFGAGIILLISLTGTWDNLQLNRVTQKAFDGLRQQGIPIAEIDAGYPLNGWHLYVHPENLAPGATPQRDVPRVTADVEKPYVIAAFPLRGYQVLRVIDWSPSFWIATNEIYVLKKVTNRGLSDE
jgi:hypothetical protein